MLKKINLILFAFILFISSCSSTLPGSSISGSGNVGSTPVYQGMTVSSLTNSSNLQSIKRQNDINQENPFELPINQRLENRIDSDLDILLQEDFLDYYGRPSETVRITINIYNPESFVILSFNLNERRYQSFEFREGSTSTRLLMDVELQSNPGVQSLTIDEIKYIVESNGNNQIQDVIMFGDQTVDVGVGYDSLPSVNLLNQTILPTSVTYSIEISDQLNMLSDQERDIYFYFFDGNTLQKEVLDVGNNEISFEKLSSKTIYQYAIVSALNQLDGEGTILNYFELEAFYTSSFIQLSVNAEKESLNYEVSIFNGLESGEVDRIELQKDARVIATKDTSIGEFAALLSNNQYEISVYYNYQHQNETEVLTESYTMTVSTLTKATPTFSFTDVNPGQEDIVFEYTVNDLDEVGNLTKVELLKGEQVIQTLTQFEDTSFSDLLSNNDYQLKATYTYDLNDGLGARTLVVNRNTKTLTKATPTFSFTDVNPGQEDITFEYVLSDLDSTITNKVIDLVKGFEVIETLIDTDGSSFDNLSPVTEYIIKVQISYNLNDGFGQRVLNDEIVLQTLGYTLSFVTNGGDYIEPTTEFYLQPINKPDNTKTRREGHTFVGWYLDQDLNTEFKFGETLTQNLTIYAKWQINSYRLKVVKINETIKYVKVANLHVLALTSTGRVFTWGDNSGGQLGNGTRTSSITPINITQYFNLQAGESITNLSGGRAHSFALTNLGRVFSWGSQNFGVLGHNLQGHKLFPFEITEFFQLEIDDYIIDIQSQDEVHAIALSYRGKVFTWGATQLSSAGTGDGTTNEHIVPNPITHRFGLNNSEQIMSVYMGRFHFFALSNQDRIFAWGDNRIGNLGDGTFTNRMSPINITSKFQVNLTNNVSSIVLGYSFNYLITKDNQVFAWGSSYGSNPVNITENLIMKNGDSIKSISTGHSHGFLVTKFGFVFSWGSNSFGQLGDGTYSSMNNDIINITSMFNLDSNEKVVEIFTWKDSAFALSSTGRLSSWGENSMGQLLDGRFTESTLPIDVTFINEYEIFDLNLDFNQNIIDSIFEAIENMDFSLYLDARLTEENYFITMPSVDLIVFIVN